MMAAALFGYIPAAIAIGALAASLHWSLTLILGLSLVIYSGALQSALLGLMVLNPSFAVVFFVSLALNLRHMLYGPHLQAERPQWPRWYRWVMSYFLTDELYAAAISGQVSQRGFFGLGLILYGGWIFGTVVGALGARLVPNGLLPALGLALPALFLALLIPHIKARADIFAAGTALVVALIGRVLHWPEAYAVIAIAGGATMGWFRQRREDG
ncbi:AzlC family ABC transporter permease [Sulfobacillus harzensis]|uniref:AzlC family ABC transporter permease n=1 Tax=Sulfobacillus harzensis TaxID=2729629 RepID=A0A7Y0Q1S0_9FIRM|nr:AzlC family ABC transporter permease [Sulfobacillus harzensis]NMP22383.1 AzlC family ABC transporter permease [Sulfobacillus harzensis]